MLTSILSLSQTKEEKVKFRRDPPCPEFQKLVCNCYINRKSDNKSCKHWDLCEQQKGKNVLRSQSRHTYVI